ncbi:MAG TPA: efflux RND transporter periplasmic adaptor subunit [Terriglobales bacterium]
MATRRSTPAVPTAEIAVALLARQEVKARAQVVADLIAKFMPGTAVVVYTVEDQENPSWTAKASVGEIITSEVFQYDSGTLGTLAQHKILLVFEGDDLQRENYAHLDTRRTVACLGYVPLMVDEALCGAIELIHYEQTFSETTLDAVNEIAKLAAPAIYSALAYERERNSSLHSISRVTQMYDLEKVFNSTLEMDQLLGTIASKFQEILNVQGVNLWMVTGDELELVACAGVDPTVQLNATQRPGEGVAGDISDSGEAVLITDPEDLRLNKRNTGFEENPVVSLLAAPLMEHENLVGVVEAVNRMDGLAFDDDDQFLLTNICETASNALHNASLLQAERKVEILEALVKVSAEITSTLDLDRVLDAVVNGPSTVIPYERAVIALEQRGRVQVKAITGVTKINPEDPTTSRLQELLEWASQHDGALFVAQYGDEVDADRPETKAKFRNYFAATGMRAFHSSPLADDDGRVGILCFESSAPDFLTAVHVEMIKVLAGQATVALRNASLYREVPFINVLEPILERKRKFFALKKQRRFAVAVCAALGLAFLAAFPLPLRVDGPAVVQPARSANVQPEIPGVVQNVKVHEGDAIKRGAVLANLEDWQYRADLAAAQAKYQTAISQMNRALANNDGSEAGTDRIQAEYWESEVGRMQIRLDKTQLLSPIDGVVATPRIEDTVGRSLKPGETFAEVLNTAQADLDVAIEEEDLSLLRPGQRVSVKLDGFPTRILKGEVEIISPKNQLQGDQRFFYARVTVPNSDGSIRDGMDGRAKIFTGWRPAGEVFFRRPAMWLWFKLWSWIGW